MFNKWQCQQLTQWPVYTDIKDKYISTNDNKYREFTDRDYLSEHINEGCSFTVGWIQYFVMSLKQYDWRKGIQHFF